MAKNLPVLKVANLQSILDFFIELILLLTLAVTPFLFGSNNMFGTTVMELAAFSVLFLWFLKLINKGSFEFARIYATKPILLFLIFVLLQYCLVDSLIHSDSVLGEVYRRKIKTEGLKLVSYLIFFYSVINNFQGRRKINRSISMLVVLGFVLSLLGIIQKLSGTKKIFWTCQVTYPEVFFSSFPNRNHYASYINMIMFMTLGVLFSYFPILRSDAQRFKKGRAAKMISATFQDGIWLYILCAVLMATSTFYSLSRGGMLSFLCGLALFAILVSVKRLSKRGYLILFLVLMIILGMLVWIKAPQQIAQRFGSMLNPNTFLANKVFGGRGSLDKSTIDLIKSYPLAGVGFGAFEFIYNKGFIAKAFSGGHIKYYVDHAHNDFLELFSEVGLIGFTIFLVAVILFVFSVMKTLLRRHDPFAVGSGAGAIAALFTICVHSNFDFNFHIPANALLSFTIAGLALNIVNSQIRDGLETSLLPMTRPILIKNMIIRLIIFAALLAAFFYIGRGIIKPYLAHRICSEERPDSVKLKEAVRLDPLNDRAHFLLARSFVKESGLQGNRRLEYINLAVREVKEAIRLNPWEERYPSYLSWITKTFGV